MDLSRLPDARQESVDTGTPAPSIRIGGVPLDTDGMTVSVRAGRFALAGVQAECVVPARCLRRMRVVVVPGRDNGMTRLCTNLPRTPSSAALVGRLYRFRWQIGLCFKEWKSYANLHKFDTGNPHIAAGRFWASLCAAILKRFLAHAAQRVGDGTPVTRRRRYSLQPEHQRCGSRSSTWSSGITSNHSSATGGRNPQRHWRSRR